MTELQPGDLATDSRGVLWFVHGYREFGLHLTSRSGTFAPLDDVARLYGPLTLLHRPSEVADADRSGQPYPAP
ncbi:hypothetical protein FHR32_005166 [Streptosporangium album]|uniref:Uncharacterized protein n=1 Tax=Streptosporangium album TaxID=47479 RepID=A0A7W7RYV9_9ACTN|nr:hypothetical protein [Streptosporangium album]MBB4940789.1 hypothetical protein [Streptosporangium album]